MSRLKNMRREAFCQAYAGAAWGNAAEAYRLAGYRARTPHIAAACGDRLLTFDDISERIKALRSNLEVALKFDRMELAEIRLKIARDDTEKTAERLSAVRDLEKAMGWAEADKVNVNHGGTVAVEHRWTVDSLKGDNGSPAGQ